MNGSLNFSLAGSLPVSPGAPYTGFISNNVANNSVDFVVTGGPTSIKWAGFSGGCPIPVGTSPPRIGGSPAAHQTYADGNFVRFDDSASNGVATLIQTVSPAGITVSNSALAYTLNGAGAITGSGGLLKSGTGTLILDNSGVNDFTGDVASAPAHSRWGITTSPEISP